MVKVACSISDFIKNTGSNSALLPGPPALLIAVDKSFRFTLEDLGEDPLSFFVEASHQTGKNKIYPLFGYAAPIDFLANNDTQDTTITTDSGKPIFVRYGFNVKNIGTLSGGLCLAKALQSFNNTNLSFIEVDAQGRATVAKINETEFGGIPAIAFAPKTQMADFSNPARNNFQLSYNPELFVQKAKILTGLEGLLDMIGLIDLNLTAEGAAASSITEIHVNLVDDCCGDSVVSDIGSALLDETNFIVKKKSDGSVVTITGVTATEEQLNLAGTFVSGEIYIVSGETSDVLFGNDVEGYDITGATEVTIP